MKIKGLDLKAKPYDEETFTILGNDVTFRAQVVSDYSEFDAIYPEPKPPMRTNRNGVTAPNFNDPKYKKELEERSAARIVYMVVKSLSATPDLEFEHIDLTNAETLTPANLEKEFASMGMPEMIAAQVMNLATSANGLSQKIVGAARKSFFTTETTMTQDEQSQQNE